MRATIGGTAMALEITKLRGIGASVDAMDPFEVREDAQLMSQDVFIIREGVVCDTDKRGTAEPGGGSLLEIVLDSSSGFIPLWAQGTTLRWRFQEASLARFANPSAAKAGIEQLFGEALLLWGDAAPVRFTRDDDAWDFEIAVRPGDKCSPQGCVLARAFFPDGGRHELVIFPKMFTQSREEQVETLAHELGHVFGLRHFFALISETAAPAVVFGEHVSFSIMNYGADSRMSDADRSDLKALYRQVWSGNLTEINHTRIRLVQPYHASGSAASVKVV